MISRIIRTILIASAITVMGAAQADSVKIGFVTTLTTPAGVIGEDTGGVEVVAQELIGLRPGKATIDEVDVRVAVVVEVGG